MFLPLSKTNDILLLCQKLEDNFCSPVFLAHNNCQTAIQFNLYVDLELVRSSLGRRHSRTRSSSRCQRHLGRTDAHARLDVATRGTIGTARVRLVVTRTAAAVTAGTAGADLSRSSTEQFAITASPAVSVAQVVVRRTVAMSTIIATVCTTAGRAAHGSCSRALDLVGDCVAATLDAGRC
jgi:hypothetical protein